ncbi:ABC transporter substrate-binding protein [Longimycelium tulufanense]|uniref:ABC transporter substrate-binding protein n=1 Tax=Longimycelium tulufanense TaxID=907463 RepID=UPI001E571474|nr:ABC transporter substrate-binding protein [Longimycelium tulufanense]
MSGPTPRRRGPRAWPRAAHRKGTMGTTRTTVRWAGLLLAALLSAGCGADTGERPRSADSGVQVTNCDRPQSFPESPRRVVSMNQHATEMLLTLGLGDRMVGTAYPDSDDVPPQLADSYRKIPKLSDRYPTFEQVLAAEPDLVVGGYASAFAEKEGRGRKALEDRGIRTLLLTENCTERTTFDTVAEDLRMFGRVFGVPNRAEKVVSGMKARLDAVRAKLKDVEPVPVFFYDSGKKSAFTVGGRGLGNEIAAMAGGRNVFADNDRVFGDASWEQVAERAPRAVVIIDYLGSGQVDTKREYLRDHPLAGATPGVSEGRFIVLALPDIIEGIRMPDAVERLARALHPEVAW